MLVLNWPFFIHSAPMIEWDPYKWSECIRENLGYCCSCNCIRIGAPENPHSRDSLDKAGESCRSGTGLSLMLFLGTILSFLYGTWFLIRTFFYTIRACLCNKEAPIDSISDISANLRNVANAIDENFGNPNNGYHTWETNFSEALMREEVSGSWRFFAAWTTAFSALDRW